jgi:hypothetical protein
MKPALRQLRRTALTLWSRAWALVQVEMPREEVGWLLTARHHLSLLESRQAAMLLSRMRLIAGLFAMLTPLWIFVDMFAFDTEVWLGLAFARIVTTLAFAGIVVAFSTGYVFLPFVMVAGLSVFPLTRSKPRISWYRCSRPSWRPRPWAGASSTGRPSPLPSGCCS